MTRGNTEEISGLKPLTLALTAVGAVAILAFVASLLTDGALSDTLRFVAGGAAVVCAAIGVMFALAYVKERS